MYTDGYVPQGWQCPKCKRIYSPTYPWCIFCTSDDKSVVVTDKASSEIDPAFFRCECFHQEYGQDLCYGTKEREVCTCGGNKLKCNFYPRTADFVMGI